MRSFARQVGQSFHRTSRARPPSLASALAAALTVLVSSAGCGSSSSFQESGTRVVFNPAATDFWSLPFPADLRKLPDGSYGFSRWPRYRARSPLASSNDLVKMWLAAADDRLHDGFGVSSGVFLPVSGPIDPSSLPATPQASLAAGASAFLIDVDPSSPDRGSRLPISFSFRATGDAYSPPNLIVALQVFGFVRRPHTQYALVVTDAVRDAKGAPLGRSRAFHDGWTGSGPIAASFAPVRDVLARINVDAAHVVGAAVFTTMDPSELGLRLAAWVETLPEPNLAAPWTVKEEYPSYQVLTSEYLVPVIQSGQRPYREQGEGRIVFGADNKPMIREMQRVRLAVTIPKKPQPAAGFPMVMYLHGSGGEWYQAIDRGPLPLSGMRATLPEPTKGTGPAEWLARRGIATAGFDFPLHGNRNDPPDTTGLVFYNLFENVQATIDNFHVAVIELMILSRLLTRISIDASLAATLDSGSASDRRIRFDRERLMGMGHSMGSTLGMPWAAVDPRIKALFVSGGGGTLLEVAVNALEPVELRPLLERLIEYDEGRAIDVANPLLHGLQHLWDLVDPVPKAAYITRAPLPGREPKDVFMTAGFRDGYFHPGAQSAVAVALGVRFAGDVVEPMLPESLDLAGRQRLSFPAGATLNGHTAVVAQYQVPFNLGHYVAFDLESARYQYTCFLASVGTRAQGARVPAAGPLDAPCPND